MALYNSVTELIGGTPLLRLCRLEREKNLSARLLVKLEKQNPGGSAKDRIALAMIARAEAEGHLTEGTVIVEPTSGNTGIGLSLVGAALGYRVILTMPESMSRERRTLLSAYGAELVLTDAAEGMAGAIRRAKELAASLPSAWIPSQFDNPENPAVHRATTGPEIWQDTAGEVDVFVASVGTGGTFSGVASYLKEQNAAVRCVAVEPAASPVLSGGQAGAHKLQGIGAGFIPANMNVALCDEMIPVTDEDAYEATRLLARCEGVLCGISSGATLSAALAVASRPEMAGRTVVALLADTGERYLSTPDLF